MFFHTGSVWAQGLTEVILLRFHFVPASCERGLHVRNEAVQQLSYSQKMQELR